MKIHGVDLADYPPLYTPCKVKIKTVRYEKNAILLRFYGINHTFVLPLPNEGQILSSILFGDQLQRFYRSFKPASKNRDYPDIIHEYDWLDLKGVVSFEADNYGEVKIKSFHPEGTTSQYDLTEEPS